MMEPLDSAALDGNAIGGLLIEVFGTEMTTATGICGTCGAASQVAELTVYLRGLGTVVRCRGCESVLMVFVRVRGITCVDLQGLASLGWGLPVIADPIPGTPPLLLPAISPGNNLKVSRRERSA